MRSPQILNWVVTSAGRGGGSGPVMYDHYVPDAWLVEARQLDAHSQLVGDGKTLKFSQGQNYSNEIKHLSVIGRKPVKDYGLPTRVVLPGDIIKIKASTTLVYKGPRHVQPNTFALVLSPRLSLVSDSEQRRLENSKWLVTSAKMADDSYAEALLVEALQLDAHGLLFDEAMRITFALSEHASTNIETAMIVGRMQTKLNWICGSQLEE